MPVHYFVILLLITSSVLQIVYVAIGSNTATKRNLRNANKELMRHAKQYID